LTDVANLRTEVAQADLLDLSVTDTNSAQICVVKPLNQLYDRRLAGTGGTTNCRRFSFFKLCAEAVQDFLFRASRVVKIDVFEFNASIKIDFLPNFCILVNCRFSIDDVRDKFSSHFPFINCPDLGSKSSERKKSNQDSKKAGQGITSCVWSTLECVVNLLLDKYTGNPKSISVARVDCKHEEGGNQRNPEVAFNS